jgi:hypothetical protein
MKNIKLLLDFRKKFVVDERVLPVSRHSLKKIISSLPKILVLCFDKISGFQGRLVIANNFIQFLMKLNKHHGATFTVKWLKSCAVALQKWLGDDKLSSLREIEPNLPLPRLINGCPSIINRSDRFLMKKGDRHAAVSLIRFWHSMFSLYRIFDIPGKLKLSTITDPFSGSIEKLEMIRLAAQETVWPKDLSRIAAEYNLGPRTFHFSGKASPSQVNSSHGLLTDIYLLLAHKEGEVVFHNILKYLSVIGSRWNTQLFLQRLNDAKDIIMDLPEDCLPQKKSMISPFGQLASKVEAAGKIRVFALVDSVTQSVMKPLHLALFEVLKGIPNDGTFDQDAGVQRCSEKAIRYNQAYSFDLSAATDRLPVTLTAVVFESLFRLKDLGQAWKDVVIERDFSFSTHTSKAYNLEDKPLRYSVGQPMGCLTSWAGLAITHHWIMQYCSFLLSQNWDWEERYEVLGDDIVIFDKALAFLYASTMKDLGLEINFSKSLSSHSSPVFEFAKRTVSGLDLVSGITLTQIQSCVSFSSRVNNVHQWIQRGYITSISSILSCLNNFKQEGARGLEVHASAFSLACQSKIEQATLMSSIVDPSKGIYFDPETSFEVPVNSLIEISRDTIVSGSSAKELSHLDIRSEWYEEGEPQFAASVLQNAFNDIKVLATNHLDTLNEWSRCLVKPELLSDLQLSRVSGWLEELVIDEYTKANDPYELEDEVEKLLIYHAKTQMVSFEKAVGVRDKVEALSFKFSAPTKISTQALNRLDNQILRDMLNPILLRGPQYWSVASPQN